MSMEFDADPYIAEQQIRAVIFCLVAFAHIDNDFAPTEKAFIRQFLAQLAEARVAAVPSPSGGPPANAARQDIVQRWTQHSYELLDEFEAVIAGYFSESVAQGETTAQFVQAKLKLGCFELLRHFDGPGQQTIVQTVQQLMHADGVITPEEQAFVDEITALVGMPSRPSLEPLELSDADLVADDADKVVIEAAHQAQVRVSNHPWFQNFEWDFARDAQTFGVQSAADMQLITNVQSIFTEQCNKGRGKLTGVKTFDEFANQEPFRDGYVYVLPTDAQKDHELLVVGDLHGCYSCLKAALMQADVFNKMTRHRDNPALHPPLYLVFLGDYIDRGRFSYSGVLRTIMQLVLSAPEYVFMLRGNHEFYIEHKGRVLAPVKPSEAMTSIADVASNEVFRRYMNLFDSLANALVVGKTMFVHGGIPRADFINEKWTDLSMLNDPEVRFQMLWSDPSEADFVPLELQLQSARFPFGRQQFHEFMAQVGCHAMVRGHERILGGFKTIYDDPEGSLSSLFSAGGATNRDLPATSNYRQVTPMALSVKQSAGKTYMSPFLLDYERYNDPKYNAFFRV